MWKNIKVIRKDSLGMLEQQINFKNLRFFFFFSPSFSQYMSVAVLVLVSHIRPSLYNYVL